jgi:predicted nuclease with TOPRIM domain
MATAGTMKRLVRAPAKALRRHLVPEYENLLRDVGLAFESVAAAHQGIADLQAENERLRAEDERLRARVDDVSQRLAEVEDGLHEARRLNLRIAELTDVVTELVLPLHDRDIDPKKLDTLAPDTL